MEDFRIGWAVEIEYITEQYPISPINTVSVMWPVTCTDSMIIAAEILQKNRQQHVFNEWARHWEFVQILQFQYLCLPWILKWR